MTVSKTTYVGYATLVGTIAEVVGALATEKIPKSKVISIFYNGTNMTAVYSL